MWQLFNSCTATLHNSLVQEVNKNSISTRNSRGYLGRENIMTQIGTCPESEDLHTCACKKCHGSLHEPPAPPLSSLPKECCLQQFESCLFYSVIPRGPNILTFGERHDLEGRMSSRKQQVLYHGVSQRPRSENGPKVWKLLPWQKGRWGIMEDRIFCTTQEKMRGRIWSPSWILPLSTLGSLCSGEESGTFVFLVECKAHSFSSRPVLPACFTHGFFKCICSPIWFLNYNLHTGKFVPFFRNIFCIEICSFVNPTLKI